MLDAQDTGKERHPNRTAKCDTRSTDTLATCTELVRQANVKIPCKAVDTRFDENQAEFRVLFADVRMNVAMLMSARHQKGVLQYMISNSTG